MATGHLNKSDNTNQQPKDIFVFWIIGEGHHMLSLAIYHKFSGFVTMLLVLTLIAACNLSSLADESHIHSNGSHTK